jgi:hypothetical protein
MEELLPRSGDFIKGDHLTPPTAQDTDAVHEWYHNYTCLLASLTGVGGGLKKASDFALLKT